MVLHALGSWPLVTGSPGQLQPSLMPDLLVWKSPENCPPGNRPLPGEGFLGALENLPVTLDMEQERAEALKLLKRRAGRPLHVMYSMPPGDLLTRISPWTVSGKMASRPSRPPASWQGYIVFHPARLRDEVKTALRQLNQSLKASGEATKPFWEHVHADALGLGDMHQYSYWSPPLPRGRGRLPGKRERLQPGDRMDLQEQATRRDPALGRWNEKENRFEDDVYTLFSYLMTHAAYVQGKRAVRTFGYLNPQARPEGRGTSS